MQRSTLDQFGLVRLFTGDKVIVSLTVNERGEVIQDLVRVESPINPAPPAESKPEDFELRAVVKFFKIIDYRIAISHLIPFTPAQHKVLNQFSASFTKWRWETLHVACLDVSKLFCNLSWQL